MAKVVVDVVRYTGNVPHTTLLVSYRDRDAIHARRYTLFLPLLPTQLPALPTLHPGESYSHTAKKGEPESPVLLHPTRLHKDLQESARHIRDRSLPVANTLLPRAIAPRPLSLPEASRDHDCPAP